MEFLEKHRSALKLSVVVIAFNMARELPRTLRSLSPLMQKDIEVDDYEIIVIDNGSSKPFNQDACQAISPNIRFIYHDPRGSVSPVKAINRGLDEAKGELVGVCIDGARMASPGLLSLALDAARISSRPVIGSLGFHLGPEVQMKSVHKGYDQDTEDKLLETRPWQDDGYELFKISVFAASSGHGWFTLPGETNALFMTSEMWKELGGFDARFQEIGGGLTNLDMWYRSCTFPNNDVILLLGEATFHQFHGGVATNSKVGIYKKLDAEYQKIHGKSYVWPKVPFKLYGSFKSVHTESFLLSRKVR